MLPGQGQCLEFNKTLGTKDHKAQRELMRKFGYCLPPRCSRRVVLTREKVSSDYYTGLIVNRNRFLCDFSLSGYSFYLFLLQVNHPCGRHHLGKISSLS